MLAIVTSGVTFWALLGTAFALLLVTFGAIGLDAAAWRGMILACGQCQGIVQERAARVRDVALCAATGLMIIAVALLALAAVTGT